MGADHVALDRLRLGYDGPSVLTATETTPQSVTVSLQCPDGLPAGTAVGLTVWDFRAARNGEIDLESIAVEGGSPAPTLEPPETFEALADRDLDHQRFLYCAGQVREPLEPGSAVHFHLSVTPPQTTALDVPLGIHVRPPTAESYEPAAGPIRIPIEAGPVADLVARVSPTSPHGDGRLTVTPVDACLNPVREYEGTLVVDAAEAGLWAGATGADSTGTRADAGDTTVHVDAGDTSAHVDGLACSAGDDPSRFTVRDRDRELASTSNPGFGRTIDGWNHYLGGIHFHSRNSYDGGGALDGAYEHARDRLGLDVAAVTDHRPTGRFADTVEAAERHTDPGEFVVLPAWEWDTPRGHVNVYLRTQDSDAVPANCDPEYDEPGSEPYRHEWPADALLAPHHTNVRAKQLDDAGEPRWREYDWSVRNDRIRQVEVYQGRGNFESDTADAAWDLRNEDVGASIQDALAMGYRFGFHGGTDNHACRPTQGTPADGTARFVGLTGFLAESLTRESIWEAMNQRRTYATTGVPILPHFSVNGHLLGREGSVDADGEVSFSARLHGTAPIERVEVVSDRETVFASEPMERDVVFGDESLPAPRGETTYYYLRLCQTDGHMAWVSPVWIDPA
jgi:hypothetical protein